MTFLFTDVEGSTRLWEQQPDVMRDAMAAHDDLVRAAVEANRGRLVKSTGDGAFAAFAHAADAVAAACQVQAALAAHDWGGIAEIRARMAVHTGEADERDGDYFGPSVNRTARLMSIAHGGQVVASQATAGLVRETHRLRDLGEHRLRDLSVPERVYQILADGLVTDFPPLRSLDVLPTNLPAELTSFVGREVDLVAVDTLLRERRMVTLTGVGGVGKTRLALQAAAEAIDRYPDGVWLVELAGVDEERVVDTLASVLSIELQPGRSVEAILLEALRSRRLLLLLDNCEHVLDEARRVTDACLRAGRGVTVLATSREGLRSPGEQLVTVPSLDEAASFELFASRAAAVDATVALAGGDRDAVLRVCGRLDGIPLAIELAAVRVRMFTVDELDARLGERFRLLTGGRGVERHQTLRAAIDWSYDLLTPSEQEAFAYLSVFVGGCTMDAADAVLGPAGVPVADVLDVIGGLVDKSLVLAERATHETRYRMLETIRQYAEERLVQRGVADAVRGYHAGWCATFARAAGRGIYSPEEQVWLDRLGDEIANLRAGVTWAVAAADTDTAMRIGASFVRQALERPLLGTAHLAEQALQAPGAGDHPLRARALAEAAWGLVSRGDTADGSRMLHDALEAQRVGARYAAASYTYLLSIVGWTGDHDEAYEIAAEGLAGAEAAGDVLGEIGMRIAFASTAANMGEIDLGHKHAEQALLAARDLRQPTLIAAALFASGVVRARTEPAEALGFLYDALEQARTLGLDNEHSASLVLITTLEAFHGDARRALTAMREVLGWQLETGYAYQLTAPFYVGQQVFNRVGRPDLVARCTGYSEHREYVGTLMHRYFHDVAVDEARSVLGAERFAALESDGATRTEVQFRAELLAEIDAMLAVPDA